jgi:hypothetical protein
MHCGQLDGQGQPIQSVADLDHRGGILRVQLEIRSLLGTLMNSLTASFPFDLTHRNVSLHLRKLSG